MSPAWIAAGLLAVAAAAWFEIVRAAPGLPVAVGAQVPDLARALAGGLFLIAGATQLARWRLVHDLETARVATALLVLGAALPAVTFVGPLMQKPAALAHTAPAARLLLVVPVLVLIATGWSSSPRRGTRPLSLALTLIVLWVAAAALLADRALTSALLPMDVPVVWQVAECTAGAAWILLAAAVWRRNRRVSRPAGNWIVLAMLLMGICELLKAHRIASDPATFGFAPGLQLMAAAILATVATMELRETSRIDTARSQQLAHTLVDVQQRLARVERVQHERLHDARSAVIGVIGASRLLSQPSAQSVPDPQQLHNLMATELIRLQEMLDTDSVEQIVEFELADVVEPIVLTHRLAGGIVAADVARMRVIGRPRSTATALANLLANVRSHAPGASVTIAAMQRGSTMMLSVEDDGCGIPVSERERVLLRGVRGPTRAPGSGLGLYSAATAMTGQSGTLWISERRGGGTRAVLTLPAAHEAHLACPAASHATAAS